ncbi:hypothetical protein [Priestia endophytica]|jgi:hypothetical protein|uniref:Sublancin immunity protein SunI-like PH domain-containing protein n=1 Tax=Priestia endophytica TaxID=135735 RepID=A0AAX1QE82_9BACI|nr:hypothetical protein [Priestia endophytica]MCM3538353.1 hypothetical protein [Priestia endophytica]RAS80665.1 hypothetical protein A3864_04455 [Priestia endophytica]RAS86056.1 hypothetical protein A3863_19330 [Priestia endophytica]
MNVEKREKEFVIQWGLATIHIPLEDIIEVTEDETYGGKEKQAVRIGMPYGTTDRIVIKTVKQNYILFTTNKYKILDIINK